MGVGAGGGGGAPGAALAALEGEADYWASLRDLREAVAWAGERPPAGGAAAEGGGAFCRRRRGLCRGAPGGGTRVAGAERGGGADPEPGGSAEGAPGRGCGGGGRRRGGGGRAHRWRRPAGGGERLATLRSRFSIFVQDRVNLLVSEHQVPLERVVHSPAKTTRGRPASERVGERDWEVESTSPENFVYSSQQLLEALSPTRQSLEHSHTSFLSQVGEGADGTEAWGEVPFRFQTPEPSTLRDIFSEMNVQHRQVGVDDCTGGGNGS